MQSDQVEVKDPLKQGLKLNPFMMLVSVLLSWSERSIKTRIETSGMYARVSFRFFVEVKDPLKQGLKLHDGCINVAKIDTGWSERSIKTRIETSHLAC